MMEIRIYNVILAILLFLKEVPWIDMLLQFMKGRNLLNVIFATKIFLKKVP